MNNILLPVDGSPDANQALDIAATLATAHNATAIVIHVISHHAPSAHERLLIEAEYADELVDNVSWPKLEPGNSMAYARTIFDTQASNNQAINRILGNIVADNAVKVLSGAGVARIKTLTKDGDVADQILKAAEDHHCDTIVMGNRGLNDLQGLLLGSTSHKVAHSAACNVILVK